MSTCGTSSQRPAEMLANVRRKGQIVLRGDMVKFGVVPLSFYGHQLPAAGRDGFFGHLGANDVVDLADVGGGETGVLQEDLGDARPVVGGQPRPVILRRISAQLPEEGGIPHGQDDGAGGDQGGTVVEQVVLLQRPLHVEGGGVPDERGRIDEVKVAAQERVGRGDRDAKFQLGQDVLLHVQHLLAEVGPVGDVDAVPDLRGVDLLVLAGDEEGGDADELQFRSLDVDELAVPVDEVDAKVEGFRHCGCCCCEENKQCKVSAKFERMVVQTATK